MKRSLFILPALLVAGAASAQVTDPFDQRVGDVGMLQDMRVQKDVGITAAQRTKMQVAAGTHQQRLQDYQKQLQALGQTNPDRTKMVGFLNQLKHDVFAVLTPAQGRRLSQLTLQRLGLVSMTDAVVGKRVGLSPDQIKKITDAFNAGKARFTALQGKARAEAAPIAAPYQTRKPKNQAEATALQKEVAAKLQPIQTRYMPQFAAIGKQTDAAMLAVLTPAQQKAWTALKGAPFKAK